MKKILLAGLMSCLFMGSASAKNLETDVALGMASLMFCTTFYSENDMQIEGAIVGQSMTAHRNAGIEEMVMSKATSDLLDEHMLKYNSANKEQKINLCEHAIKFARESDFVEANAS
ncbi:hypothetical protein FM038_007295 [Shewanella eurypsychrophilus]|uniref:Uncharacterized protein n=1 Tax=Shewanella eurypsychrophilus TaxID=2593656 RepID=A0ABX6V3Q0_9GAMM|nr:MULTISPECIES: hypothetical protein [Shewanella]QFU21977.1 hypothetical protein FS418_08875 [Shewanella sp. YLB-09]QPG57266.1 hypothetical protein FM038_007295 [Shewanella eurypsychrophilus]